MDANFKKLFIYGETVVLHKECISDTTDIWQRLPLSRAFTNLRLWFRPSDFPANNSEISFCDSSAL